MYRWHFSFIHWGSYKKKKKVARARKAWFRTASCIQILFSCTSWVEFWQVHLLYVRSQIFLEYVQCQELLCMSKIEILNFSLHCFFFFKERERKKKKEGKMIGGLTWWSIRSKCEPPQTCQNSAHKLYSPSTPKKSTSLWNLICATWLKQLHPAHRINKSRKMFCRKRADYRGEEVRLCSVLGVLLYHWALMRKKLARQSYIKVILNTQGLIYQNWKVPDLVQLWKVANQLVWLKCY